MSKKINPNKPTEKKLLSEKFCVCGHSYSYHDPTTEACCVEDGCRCEKFVLNWYSKRKE